MTAFRFWAVILIEKQTKISQSEIRMSVHTVVLEEREFNLELPQNYEKNVASWNFRDIYKS